MKVFSATCVFLFFASAEGFSTPFGYPRAQSLVLSATAEASATSAVDRSVVRKAIMRMDKANFSETLSMVEPFLLNEAGITFYEKSMIRIKRSAKILGVDMPANFAKEAKATAKRRAKQDAFVQAKIDEAKAAAEAAAEAAAAEDVPEEVAA